MFFEESKETEGSKIWSKCLLSRECLQLDLEISSIT
jgi:hypothetical protein